MSEEITTEPFAFDEDEGCIIACEPSPVRDLNSLLEELHVAFGSGFVWTLKEIASHGEFKPIPGESNIFAVGGETFTATQNGKRATVQSDSFIRLE